MSRLNLFTITDEAQWKRALDDYRQSVCLVEKGKKKDVKLQELDEWYYDNDT